MVEYLDLRRLEEQLYQYRPNLKGDNEEIKTKRRKKMCLQLRYSYPLVELAPLDAISSLVNIKNLLEKCKESVFDPDRCLEMEVASSSTSLLESSGDEFVMAQRSRRISRKRKCGLSYIDSDNRVSKKAGKEQDSPLSVSILIPQVVQGSDKMEISIDLGGVDSSHLFGNRISGLLHNSSNSSITLEENIKERPGPSNKIKDLQTTAMNNIEIYDNGEKQDEMFSRLISQVLIENNDTETLQATNILDNINNNETDNYAVFPVLTNTSKKSKKKLQGKPVNATIEKGAPKKRGRKPKNRFNNKSLALENAESTKSDLAKYVELFSNTCNTTGSATPATSSTQSHQLVTSTTHYLDSSDQQPITYYIEGDWENGGSCQLLQTEGGGINTSQEEFNVAELVNYIDDIDDAGNVIASVLDGSNLFVHDAISSHSNSVIPPPAHISDVLLDLSKKSTMHFSKIATDNSINTAEVSSQDSLPLDLSVKSSNVTTVAFNTGLASLETIGYPIRVDITENFNNSDYDSFTAALDMPLIDIEDSINAFMELTSTQQPTAKPSTATCTNNFAVCDGNVGEKPRTPTTLCDLQLHGLLRENLVSNTGSIYGQTGNKFNNTSNKNEGHSTKNNSTDHIDKSQYFEPINEKTMKTAQTYTVVDMCKDTKKTISISSITDNMSIGNDIMEVILKENISAGGNEDFNDVAQNEYDGNNTELNKINEPVENKIGRKKYKITSSHVVPIFETTEKSDYEANLTKNTIVSNNSNIALLDEFDNIGNVTKNMPTILTALEGIVDNNDELNGNSSDKSSMDFLFVDTESFETNILKHFCDAPVTDSSGNNNNYDVGKPNDVMDNDVRDFSTNDNHSKSIDLTEECQGHHVSVHLSLPQLTLMDNSSEEFNSDFDIGLGSTEEKDFQVIEAAKRDPDVEPRKQLDNDINSCRKYFTQITCDSVSVCEQPVLQSRFPITETAGIQDLEKNSGRDKNINANVTETCVPESTRHISSEANERVVITEEISHKSLSLLEMESKLDDGCLDFGDELEDDVLSLATSYFNSSDDERLPEYANNYASTSLGNGTSRENDEKGLDAQQVQSADSNKNLKKCSTISKMPIRIQANETPEDVFRKFKIPKISMTTATVKHNSSTENVPTTAPLPMVILPPNVFQKQSTKTEPGRNKPIRSERLTRTIQNVCAVTPLTLMNLNIKNTTDTAAPTCSLEVVAPKIRDVLQLTTQVVADNTKSLCISSEPPINSQQIKCTRGEFVTNVGYGRNFGPPTIVVAKIFGVNCLKFLVGRCFTPNSCQYSHYLRDSGAVKNILSTLSEIDLNIAYRFAYNHEIIFRHYMCVFCKVYFEKNNRFKLLNMVRDCERYNGGGGLLNTIFYSLVDCGLNKINACRQILNYSRDRSRTTLDALVNIIFEADWIMFCDYIEKFSNVSAYHFRLNVLQQMAPTILRANDQRLTSIFFKCLVNLDPRDVGLVQSSPILMQLLELIKNGQTYR